MFRIATWNLERPTRGCSRIRHLLERIRDVKAHVWVLTETSDAIDLSATHRFLLASDTVPKLHKPGECWTTIWSQHPVRRVPTYDAKIAVCAEIDTPIGPVVVYGTVLPYHADGGESGTAKNWSEHYRIIPLQATDWRSIQANFPTRRFCVAGDLN